MAHTRGLRISLAFALFLALTTARAAHAGSGPWVVGTGQTSLYVGSETQQFSQLATSTGSRATDDILDLGSGISTLGLKAVASYGLLSTMELEFMFPWYWVRANRTDDPVCTDLGLGACEPTSGVGIVSGRAKYLLIDEVYGAPLSLALAGELRLGALTADSRARLTNLGEGTSDVGGMLALGRSRGLGDDGVFSAYAELGARYRFPNTTLDGLDVPGSEFYTTVEALLGPNRRVSLGPSIGGFLRPSGIDIEELLSTYAKDLDRFSALSVKTLHAGVKAIIFSEQDIDLVVGVLRTVYAVNNPPDTLILTAGITTRRARD